MDWGLMPYGFYGGYQGLTEDLSLWSANYPYSYATNYGGKIQFNVMSPTMYTYQQAMDMQNFGNSFYQQDMFMDSIYSSYSGLMQNIQMSPMQRSIYEQGRIMGENIGINTSLQRVASNVTSLGLSIDEAINSDKVKEKHKQELKKLKKELEKLQGKLEKIPQMRNAGGSFQEVLNEISLISSDYDKILKKVTELSKKIQEELANSDTDIDDNVESDTDIDNEDIDSDDNDADSDDNNGDDNNSIKRDDNKTGKVDNAQVVKIATGLYDHVEGIFGHTDTETDKYIKDNITKDNVVEVIQVWNEQYAPYYADDDPYGLIETLCDENFAGGKKTVKPIIDALDAKLQEYQDGNPELYNIASAQLGIAKHECNSWWCNEDKMAEAVNKAHAALVKLMNNGEK